MELVHFLYIKKKTFLVTGGTGFIGSNISNFLFNKGYNVKIFDNNSRGSIKSIKGIKKKIKFIKLSDHMMDIIRISGLDVVLPIAKKD